MNLRERMTDLGFVLNYSQAASTLVKAKPTYVVVGDITALPYADELGL